MICDFSVDKTKPESTTSDGPAGGECGNFVIVFCVCGECILSQLARVHWAAG